MFSLPEKRLDWRNWLFRVLTWDAILPFIIALVPIAIHELKLNDQAVNLIAVFILASALLVRAYVGNAYIGSNRCKSGLRVLQRIVFFIGIFWLMLLELAMILSPVNEHFRTFNEAALFIIAYSIYLMIMVVAMYPGRNLGSLTEGSNDATE